jgi:hypothetical protein
MLKEKHFRDPEKTRRNLLESIQRRVVGIFQSVSLG